MRAWIVEEGEYSDAHALAVFTDKDTALRYARRQYEGSKRLPRAPMVSDRRGFWAETIAVREVPLNPVTQAEGGIIESFWIGEEEES